MDQKRRKDDTQNNQKQVNYFRAVSNSPAARPADSPFMYGNQVPDYYKNGTNKGVPQKNGLNKGNMDTMGNGGKTSSNQPLDNENPPAANRQQRRRASKPPKKKKVKTMRLLLLLFLILEMAFGIYYLTVSASVSPYDKGFYPNVFVNGVELSGKSIEEGQRLVYEKAQNFYRDFSVRITYGAETGQNPIDYEIDQNSLNVVIQKEQLDRAVEGAWAVGRNGSVFEKKKVLDGALESPLYFTAASVTKDTTYINQVLGWLQEAIQRPPVDATVTFTPEENEPFQYTDEQTGKTLDPIPLEQKILSFIDSMQSGEIALEDFIKESQPDITRAQLEENRQQRSSYSTVINMMTRSDEKKAESQNRKVNIELSLKAISGEVQAGKVFSFNTATGERTANKGYQSAPEYQYGELIDGGVGGGVCQTSSTLHMAVVQAGMEVQKRYYHAGEVNYMDMGKDATVYYVRGHERDFIFKNTSDQSIYIVGKVLSGPGNDATCQINIYGAPMNGIFYDIAVSIEEIPPSDEVIEQKSKNLYVGEEKFVQAKSGYEVTRWLVEYDSLGNETSRTLLPSDTHAPKAAIWYIGTKQVELID